MSSSVIAKSRPKLCNCCVAEANAPTFPAIKCAWVPTPSMGTPRDLSLLTRAMNAVSFDPA